MADPVTLHIEPSTIGAIDELARKANQPRDVLVEEALQNFVKLRAWQIAKIEEGIAAADRGEFVSDEEMDAMIFSKYTTRPMRIVWTEPASRDLEDIGDYIAKDNPAAARRVVRAIEAAARRLARFPQVGALDSGGHPRTRRPENSLYRAVCRSCRSPERSKSWRCFHGARDWPNTFNPDS